MSGLWGSFFLSVCLGSISQLSPHGGSESDFSVFTIPLILKRSPTSLRDYIINVTEPPPCLQTPVDGDCCTSLLTKSHSTDFKSSSYVIWDTSGFSPFPFLKNGFLKATLSLMIDF